MLALFFINLKFAVTGLFAPLAGFAQTASSAACTKGSFLNFPTWYKYLKLNTDPGPNGAPACNPILNGLNDFWLIGLAVIEMLLRIAVLAAIIYVLIGGFKYISARGDPEKINQARTAVIDALIGVVIAIIATAGVSYIAGKFSAA